jgi:hypothetical protein
MKIRTGTKLSIAVSALLLATSQISPVQAEDNYYSSQGNAQPGNAPATQQSQNPQGYGAPGYSNPGYSQRSYGGRRDYGRNSGANSWGDSGPNFSGPWDSGRGGSNMPWDSGRGGRGGNNMPWDSGRGGRDMPWDSGRGGRDMPWDSGRGGRGDWMDKDRFADRWDDMLNAPSDMGEMPGGWNAPSISAPNPVDVGDEFGDASRDVPDQMRNVYDDNRSNNSNDRYR